MDLKKKHKLLYVFPVELSGMQTEGFELQQLWKMPEAKRVEAVSPLMSMAKHPLPISRVRVSLHYLAQTEAASDAHCVVVSLIMMQP